MSKSVRRIVVVLLVLTYIGLGFFREFVFLNINEQMRVTYYKVGDSHVSPILSGLQHFSYAELYYGKWPLTLLFAVAFAALAASIVRVALQTRTYSRWIWIAYGSVFLLGALVFLVGNMLGNAAITYDLARFLAGMVESPLLLLMLGAALVYHRRNQTNQAE